ncbi:hypothetical protein F9K81_23430, partial [Brucella anthropi]
LRVLDFRFGRPMNPINLSSEFSLSNGCCRQTQLDEKNLGGGLQPREAMQIMRGLNGLNFIGSDVVEVAPQYDPTTNTAQAA